MNISIKSVSAEIVRLVSYWEISYLFGATGFNKDHKKKLLSYFNIACNGGLTRSMLKISDFMYELGKGAQRDIVKGMAYYRRACDKGYFSGCIVLLHIIIITVIKAKRQNTLKRLAILAEMITASRITQSIKPMAKILRYV